MSAEAWAIALHHTRAKTATVKLVLLGIANHDGDGGSWPAVSTLAQYAVTSPRTVQRAVDELERLGEIKRHVQAGGTRHTADHRRPNLYEFLLRCPPDCDRTKNHRTRSRPGPTPELDGLDTGVTGDTRAVDRVSTGVTPVTPHPVTPVTPEPVQENPSSEPVDNGSQTARARDVVTWTHTCQDGRHDTHRVSRRTGACAFCGATRITYRIEE